MRHETRTVPVTYQDGTTGAMALQYPIREKDRVYIVGCAGTKDSVPWDDASAEFWGVNNLYGVDLKGQHYDRWFEIHNLWQDPRTQKMLRRGSEEFRNQPILDYLAGMAKLGCTVYMQKHWPQLVPMSLPYPLQEVISFFRDKGLDLQCCRYLTNTITYEIILAVYLGFTEIEVWGVDMAVGTEYEAQRPSCEFWLGVAAGLGVKIHIPDQADLLKTRFIYGFEEKQGDAWRAKVEKLRKDMAKKRAALEAQVAQQTAAIQQYIGGEQVTKELQRIWTTLGDDLAVTTRGV